MTEKDKGRIIFKRDLETHGCGYYGICNSNHQCNQCTLPMMDRVKFNYSHWERLRETEETKYAAFWQG